METLFKFYKEEFEKMKKMQTVLETQIKFVEELGKKLEVINDSNCAVIKKFDGLTTPLAIKALMEEQRRPMQKNKIVKELMVGGFSDNYMRTKWNVTSTLRRHKYFVKIKHGTYTLADNHTIGEENNG